MTESKSKTIKYFGFGTNKDLDMMIHMVGNPNLKGEHGKLIGYELCIQNINQIRDGIIPPFKKSPREIIKNGFGNSFKLYVIRPKEGKIGNWLILPCKKMLKVRRSIQKESRFKLKPKLY